MRIWKRKPQLRIRRNTDVPKLTVQARRFDKWMSEFYVMPTRVKNGKAAELQEHLRGIKDRISYTLEKLEKHS